MLLWSGRTYGPPGHKRCIFFIDDLNMPHVDNYDTQSVWCCWVWIMLLCLGSDESLPRFQHVSLDNHEHAYGRKPEECRRLERRKEWKEMTEGQMLVRHKEGLSSSNNKRERNSRIFIACRQSCCWRKSCPMARQRGMGNQDEDRQQGSLLQVELCQFCSHS